MIKLLLFRIEQFLIKHKGGCLDQLPENQLVTTENDYLKGVIKEVLKYSFKTGAMVNWTPEKTALFCDWITATQGKNFLNCAGCFRGLGIFSQNSKYDKKPENDWQPDDLKYFLGKTSQVRVSANPAADYSTKGRRKILENVRVVGVPTEFENVTDVAEHLPAIIRQIGNGDDSEFWQENKGNARTGYHSILEKTTQYRQSLARALASFRRPETPTLPTPDFLQTQLSLDFDEIERLAAFRANQINLNRAQLEQNALDAFS